MITNVAPLMPHTGHMMLISRILSYSAREICTEIDVDDKHIFASAGKLPVWAFAELMAQSIGALAGALAHDAGQPIRTGFFLGTRKLVFCPPSEDLPLPVTLRCEVVESLHDASGLGVFDCQLFHGQRRLAFGALSVFCPEKSEEI